VKLRVNLSSVRSPAFAVVLSAILILSISYYWPIEDPYHPLNSGWNGCSKVASAAANVTLLSSYSKLSPNSSSLLAIIGPNIQLSDEESSNVRSFLEAGGTVLVADDFGTGNSLLQRLEIGARFSGKPLADLYYYDKDPGFPIIRGFSPSSLTENVSVIILNRPSFLEIDNSSQVTRLASSSPFSFIDLSGENRPLANETIDSYPVMAAAKIGRGTLILISDPSMFVNDMIDLNDNMQLFRNMLRIGHSSLFFDVAHLSRAPLTDWRIRLKGALDSVRVFLFSSENHIYVQSIVVAFALGLVFSLEFIRRRRRQWRRG